MMSKICLSGYFGSLDKAFLDRFMTLVIIFDINNIITLRSFFLNF